MPHTLHAIARIDGDIEPPRRYTLSLIEDGGRYRWIGEAGEDTEVSGATAGEATAAARAAWYGERWNLEIFDATATGRTVDDLLLWAGAVVAMTDGDAIALALGRGDAGEDEAPELTPEQWREAAVARVEGDPQLEEYSPAIMYDWHEGAAHWQWVATAPVAEIVAWAQSVDVSEEAAPWEGLTLRHARYREDTDR